MFKIIVWGDDGLEAARFQGDNLYDLVLKLNIYKIKSFPQLHAVNLFQNDKQPSETVWRKYNNMLNQLMALAKKMVAMEEDF